MRASRFSIVDQQLRECETLPLYEVRLCRVMLVLIRIRSGVMFRYRFQREHGRQTETLFRCEGLGERWLWNLSMDAGVCVCRWYDEAERYRGTGWRIGEGECGLRQWWKMCDSSVEVSDLASECQKGMGFARRDLLLGLRVRQSKIRSAMLSTATNDVSDA